MYSGPTHHSTGLREKAPQLNIGHEQPRMEETMATLVDAAIRGLGDRYADGTERIEIHVPSDHDHGLPYCKGIRVPIVLHVGGEPFDA